MSKFNNSARLQNLDYLRGIVAFGIMIFHYSWWVFGNEFKADTFISRVGIYGVSIFYVLSGLTLFYVYNNKMDNTFKDFFFFAKKRFFRIFPLLWIVTFLSILLAWKVPNLKNLFLNLTGLFGFVKWNVYFSTGVWSIGNEIVFYFFFPFFLFLNKYNKYLLIVIGLIIFFLYVYFAFDVLDSNITLSKQWKNYTNPLNQLFLFFGGFIIGKTYINSNINNKINISLILFSLLLFCVYPVDGDRINLVTGFNRIVFTFCSFLVCLSFFKFNYSLPKIFVSPFSFLGEASYSIYLLHPIIYKIVDVFSDDFFQFSNFFKVFVSVFLTILISYFSYNYFEKYFIKLGVKKY